MGAEAHVVVVTRDEGEAGGGVGAPSVASCFLVRARGPRRRPGACPSLPSRGTLVFVLPRCVQNPPAASETVRIRASS